MLPALLFLLSGPVFAQNKPHHFEAGFALPMTITGAPDEQIVPAPGLAAGYYYDTIFSIEGVPIGLGAWAGFGVTFYGHGNVGRVFNIISGPVATVWRNERFAVPVAFGYYFNAATLNGSIANGLGLGANAALQWRFSSDSYAYARLQAAFTFTGGGELTLCPGICVGIALNK